MRRSTAPAATKGGSWGHAIRAATATERVAGTDPAGGEWIRRACSARCAEPVVYRISWRVTGRADKPRIFQSFKCATHAERFAKRHALVLPSAILPVDQALLPFGGI